MLAIVVSMHAANGFLTLTVNKVLETLVTFDASQLPFLP
jgi:hypothetical protein